MLRASNRKINELRDVELEININKYAEGSCLISVGDTKVICTATIEDRVPFFLKGTGKGWLTAEYSMLPRSTATRIQRDSVKPSSRGVEIQRLIGRSLRACLDLSKLHDKQILIDCDVIQADGGTRCAAITGGFIALNLAIKEALKNKKIKENPIKFNIAAVSCGVYKNSCVLDLDYEEDSNCESDVNFVMTENGDIIEIQGTAEGQVFSFSKMEEMYALAKGGIESLVELQKQVIED